MKVLDVTLPLMFYLHDSKLKILASNKSLLIGFYDIAPGEEKQILIIYSKLGENKKRIYDEKEIIDL